MLLARKSARIRREPMPYNLNRFHLDDHDLVRFDGPRAGEPAVDFTLCDTDGQTVSLSDYKGKWLVLEMGAVSCGSYSGNIKPNNLLAKDYPDVEFLVVYVREPHPGERIGPHSSMEEKIENAKGLRSLYGEYRKVVVDSLDGDMHTKYGLRSNSIYVINPEGQVIYRCDWTVSSELKKVLDNRDQLHRNEHAGRAIQGLPDLWTLVKSLFKGGFQAIWDFIRMIPRLGPMQKEADKYYKNHGHLARGETN